MPEFSSLPTIITLLIALSVASERVVEMIKGLFWRQLNERQEDPGREARRRVWLHVLGALAGVGVSALAWPVVVEVVPGDTSWLTVVALGLLASGGSGFWNTILTYVLNIKELKKTDVEQARGAAGAARPLPQPTDGVLSPGH
ncbi:MAG TPA: hypothetical protein VGA02_00130 [Gemmatimonadales bacterium]|jgi:hypothetical protein